MAHSPRFRLLQDRGTPIVSVLSHKGGVGTTTVTALLAWALARRNYRVLLGDLDLQGSSSSLFIPPEILGTLDKDDCRLLRGFLSAAAIDPTTKLLDYALPLPQYDAASRLVATTDRLAYSELSLTVQCLLRVVGTKDWSGRRDGRMFL